MTLPAAYILCLEVDKDWFELMELMFEYAEGNFKITLVSTIREALILIGHIKFDLYILDYVLPDGTGIEVCRKIREMYSDSPIMFYTAMAQKIERETAIKSGANEYLIKPDNLSDFLFTVKRLLSKSDIINSCVREVEIIRESESLIKTNLSEKIH